MSVNSKTDLLLSQRGELIKSYSTFDAEGRVEFIYTAPRDAERNHPCTVVQYIYTAPGSQNIQTMAEGKARWDDAWDAGITVTSTLPAPI